MAGGGGSAVKQQQQFGNSIETLLRANSEFRSGNNEERQSEEKSGHCLLISFQHALPPPQSYPTLAFRGRFILRRIAFQGLRFFKFDSSNRLQLDNAN